MIGRYIKSSIGKKQIVAVSGLIWVGFLIGHLSGNLLIYKGPEALNNYSKFLHDLGSILWVFRIGLIIAFLLHVIFIIWLVIENKKARKNRYEVAIHDSTRSISTKTMRITAIIIFVYIGWHLLDYTWTHPSPTNAVVNGEFLGLYGLVYNSLLNPFRALFYIIAMIAIGFHLSHAIQSTAQTFGITHGKLVPMIKKISVGIGGGLAIGFSSIPVYIWLINFN